MNDNSEFPPGYGEVGTYTRIRANLKALRENTDKQHQHPAIQLTDPNSIPSIRIALTGNQMDALLTQEDHVPVQSNVERFLMLVQAIDQRIMHQITDTVNSAVGAISDPSLCPDEHAGSAHLSAMFTTVSTLLSLHESIMAALGVHLIGIPTPKALIEDGHVKATEPLLLNHMKQRTREAADKVVAEMEQRLPGLTELRPLTEIASILGATSPGSDAAKAAASAAHQALN